MVKVTIETTGKEKQILTGDMVNAMVLDDKEFNFAFVKSSKNAINGLVFVSSLVHFVQGAIKAFSNGDSKNWQMLNVLFALEMSQAAKERCNKELKEEQQDSKKDVENHELDELFEILRKAVEE